MTAMAEAFERVMMEVLSDKTGVYEVPLCALIPDVITGEVKVKPVMVVTVAPDGIEVDPRVGAEYPADETAVHVDPV